MQRNWFSRFFFLFTFALCSAVGTASANTLRLVNADGSQVANYEAVAGAIPADTEVQFQHRSFRVKAFIESGGSEHVYDLGEGKVLRISRYYRPGEVWQNHFLKGYQELRAGGVAVPHVYVEESESGQFTVVEKIGKEFSLQDLLENRPILSKAAQERVWLGFADFAQTTAAFSSIADFQAKNIVWTGDRWLLLDWDSNHVSARGLADANAFARWFYLLPPPIYHQCEGRIKRARLRFSENTWNRCRGLLELVH